MSEGFAKVPFVSRKRYQWVLRCMRAYREQLIQAKAEIRELEDALR